MLKTKPAKLAGVKIWRKTHVAGEHLPDAHQHEADGSITIYSLSAQKGHTETDQAPGWELYLFDFKSERAAFMEGMSRGRPLGSVSHVKETMTLNGQPKQALLVAFEDMCDYMDLIEDIGGTRGDLIVHAYIE